MRLRPKGGPASTEKIMIRGALFDVCELLLCDPQNFSAEENAQIEMYLAKHAHPAHLDLWRRDRAATKKGKSNDKHKSR